MRSLMEKEKAPIDEHAQAPSMKSSVTRLVQDIRDVDLIQHLMPLLNSAQTQKLHVVCIGKHVCGLALDLTLRCICKCIDKLLQQATIDIATASCCHYLCTWDTYVNRPYFEARGFTKETFKIVCALSQWATMNPKEKETVNPDNLNNPNNFNNPNERSRMQKISLGKACKKLLDEGRIEWLKSNGFNVEIKRYTNLSKEDQLLLGCHK